jgi:hypothetical protein
MNNYKSQLRVDNAHSPAFLMVKRPPPADERKERLAEWIMAVWMNVLDPNILGIRRVDDDKSGDGVPVVYIAIPLDYRRKNLAITLAIAQLEDEQITPRVNLVASAGSDDPHSFIRVPAEVIFSKFISAIEFQLLDSKEFNDPTINDPERAADEFVRSSPRKKGDDDTRLRSVIERGLALRNVSLRPEQIRMLTHKKTGERWVQIKNVDRRMRPTVQQAIAQAGVNATTPTKDDLRRLDWAILFAASEADKLLFGS